MSVQAITIVLLALLALLALLLQVERHAVVGREPSDLAIERPLPVALGIALLRHLVCGVWRAVCGVWWAVRDAWCAGCVVMGSWCVARGAGSPCCVTWMTSPA